MSGASGPRAQQAEAFAEALGSVGVPVELQDERLSTVEAERGCSARPGSPGRRRRSVVDESAATVILEAWLDAHR
jgi:putative Holliday junction resolvase